MNSEFIKGGQLAFEVVNRLWQMQPLRGARYNNILLSNSEPDVIDNLHASTQVKYATLYWPGGSPEHGHNLETVAQEASSDALAVGAEVARIRRALLGAYVGEAALARVPIEMRQAWQAIETQAPGRSIQVLDDICSVEQLPLAVCVTSEITDGEPDTRVMHLWHPTTIHPAPVLDRLQQVVQHAINKENPCA
ncbi:MAG TPA: hypothetical protein VJR27_02560 [Candidatus Saccharimonadales bacterium]|nr:hypothetical protein [Candidatus Saccharimonadales bacterium]